jgi:hypothetical protein
VRPRPLIVSPSMTVISIGLMTSAVSAEASTQGPRDKLAAPPCHEVKAAITILPSRQSTSRRAGMRRVDLLWPGSRAEEVRLIMNVPESR